jgi:hypothetical protein
MSKYGAKRTTVDGITFHSAGEARRYQELRLLEKAGEISDLELQPVFSLSVMGGEIGKYIADFQYWDTREGAQVVEDFKGFDTPLGKWKRKHAERQHGISVLVTRKAGR